MIRMIQSSSAGHAKAYFNEALLKSDYYLDDQELAGRFLGRLAARLGIEGIVTKETFHALCDNINPKTREQLTPRNIDQRTVGYDVNFHCPKSVSILNFLAKDEHILEAFKASVQETMLDIEADSKTRIRKGGQYNDRETGELVWAEFVHQTARPVDGSMPDPHLHSHCFVMNATFDKTEEQFKAGQFRDIKRDMPYYQARFHKRLSDNLIALGYTVRQTEKSFEVEGVPQKVIDLFSKRTDEIGRIAKEKGITSAKELDGLGARTRSKKQKGHTMASLKQEWKQQIKALGMEDGDNVAVRFATEKAYCDLTPLHCLEHALLHRFERASVMQDRRILETAYRHAIGQKVNIDQITKAFQEDTRILHVKERHKTVCTTREVLAEEKCMVNLANQGKGKLKPLYRIAPAIKLDGEQAEAIRHILTTTDRVSIIRGAAGTGKTTLMGEAIDLIQRASHSVTVVAPTTEASRGVLRQEGFKTAETVAWLLVDKELQNALQGQVLWVDEAGLLGTKDMTALLDLATRKNARLILGGDTRQHASVVRGDALRILSTVAGIKSAEVSKIYRQKNKDYKEAVNALSNGNVKQAFDKLDGIGAIKGIDPLKPNGTLVEDYISVIRKGKSALIISPTHQQGDEVTKEVRQKLRAEKLIGKKELTIPRLINLNLTEAQKNDVRSYKSGQAIRFNQNMKGIKRGSIWTVNAVKGSVLELTNQENKTLVVPIDQNRNFDLYQKSEIGISKGDKIRITREGFDVNDKRLNNGQMMEVLAVKKKGHIKLRNTISKTEYTISQDYAFITHAHCITSHASQGKTVDEVFISQPAATFPATDMKQFYVSVSRGKDRVHIYTDDKEELMQHASEIGDRQSALELIGKKHKTLDVIDRHLRNDLQREPSSIVKNKTIEKPEPIKSHYNEPEI